LPAADKREKDARGAVANFFDTGMPSAGDETGSAGFQPAVVIATWRFNHFFKEFPQEVPASGNFSASFRGISSGIFPEAFPAGGRAQLWKIQSFLPRSSKPQRASDTFVGKRDC
jgi:hypothetical protein